MAKPKKHARYTVTNDHIFQHSVLHKTTNNFFIVMEDLDFYASNNPEVVSLRLGSAHETVYYVCELEALRNAIEDGNFDSDLREGDGAEGLLIPVTSSFFKKKGGITTASSSEDSWIKIRTKFIEEAGGPWSYEQRKAWASKFKASTNPKNKPNVGWAARGDKF
jgi:hypothetical protein